MNRRMILHTLGQIIRLEAVLLLLPAVVALLYGEMRCLKAFLLTAALAAVLGSLLTLLTRSRSRVIFSKEGFVTVSLAWLCLSAIGAVPFVLSGGVSSYVDAFFETVSGFTTTGSSILPDVEALPRGLLFWRSFTHWIGGMGILVLMMAIVPADSGRSMHMMRAEMPGPVVGKLVPRVRDTAKLLYVIYLGLTVLMVVLLRCGGMSLYDSLIHAFGTAGTGGFGTYRTSLADFSPYIQWVVTVFMLLFGVNFNLYYLMLVRHFRAAWKSRELWVYLALVAVSSGLICWNIRGLYGTWGETIRQALFQVSSIMTTTGYATADFNLWPGLSKAVLLLLMFIGGCAGSTAGGLKVSRVQLLWASARRDLQRALHPRSVSSVRLEGKRVEEATVQGAGAYLVLYVALLALGFMLISFGPFGLETNLTAVITCLNNVGPGFGMVGPSGGFAAYSDFSKLVLSMAMLFGRLEIYPLLFLLSPSTWIKK